MKALGRPLPGVSARVVTPDTDDELDANEDGMLLISGPNVMKGYANRDDLTRDTIHDGWYVTGDIAHIDQEGFIHITGRLSRFSKIGGEMVPHAYRGRTRSAVPRRRDDEQIRVCVTAVPDAKKGERLIVLHLNTEKDISEIRKALSDAGLPNLFIPSQDSFLEIDEIPMLGTGKLDLKGAKQMAADMVAA